MLVLFRIARVCGLCCKRERGSEPLSVTTSLLVSDMPFLRQPDSLQCSFFCLLFYWWFENFIEDLAWILEMKMAETIAAPVLNFPNIPFDNRKPLSDLFLSRRQNIQKNIRLNLRKDPSFNRRLIILIWLAKHCNEKLKHRVNRFIYCIPYLTQNIHFTPNSYD